MAKAPVAALRGDRVEVADAAEANRLYNRHAVGAPRPGNSLELSLVEAAWCAEAGRLEVQDGPVALGLAQLLERGARGGGRTEVDFLAYRDLRERGLVVRHDEGGGPGAFSVWPRGEGPPKPAWFALRVRAERDPVPVAELAQWAAARCVVGVVDEDGGVTYYQAAPEEPGGEVAEGALPPATGTLLDDRVLVDDEVAAAAYSEREATGTRVGGRLVLSFVEAEALRRRGVLSVSSEVTARARAQQPHFERTLPVHLDLRLRGAVPKSGLKFGTHLRAYRGDPDREHAEWLVHCAAAGDVLHWSELARAVRLAHGVRKTFLVAAVGDGGRVEYVALSWFRP